MARREILLVVEVIVCRLCSGVWGFAGMAVVLKSMCYNHLKSSLNIKRPRPCYQGC